MTDEHMHVRKGVGASHDGMTAPPRKTFRKKAGQLPDLAAIVRDITNGSVNELAKAITYIESNAPAHYRYGQELLQSLLKQPGQSIRIGITGVPGAGKSTFIESFGMMLCEHGHRVAVLAIDPSSSISGGSILGDKTRMEQLSKHPNAFIRPSPSSGTLGGVHRKTRETMLLCEAAGFDVILIETVGVGQSEFIVRGMVDFFMLLTLTGAGDELQGMKKGIMELADAVVVNKADGDNKMLAEKTKREYDQILHVLKPSTKGWESKAYTCSALKNEGIDAIWTVIQTFKEKIEMAGTMAERRRSQTKEWMHTLIGEQLNNYFYRHPYVKEHLADWEKQSMDGLVTPAQAAEKLFQEVFQKPI
ncbi:methylmalonyl Co-A mutase-associated GTPase MeaB [Domibacillus sp. A3M-37]|uniref:methylmalonyl Co-A mutase-associated GTPase MeaB n=1 Tax=Domibacillus TaxID=1433999 RepID=UPI000617B7B5|nr:MULTISPECIES: methylmalonyl Co-A mutase-associated GTPase MeaB [Domibacillus]MCP3763266.1 methylmalonyl Co-A mutase-associated GTPase MeaB [Domibacillus sp. A3M-37]